MCSLAKTSLLLLSAMTFLTGCSSSVSSTEETKSGTSTRAEAPEIEVTKTMEKYFQEGLKRPFGPGGPRFELPSAYYEYFALHLGDASQFLEGKFTSTHGAEGMNAYDIVAHMARFPADRDWAMAKMKQAIDSGNPVKFMIQPTYDQIEMENGK